MKNEHTPKDPYFETNLHKYPHIVLDKVQNIPCGCSIEGHGLLPSPAIIDFCPMHKAAPEMLETLKPFAKFYQNLKDHPGNYPKQWTSVLHGGDKITVADLAKAHQAIAKAEGGTT